MLEARVRQKALPRLSSPEERDGDAREKRPNATRSERAVSSPTAGASACSARHATTSTAGSSAAESSADTGGGASEWASGSQLCTGAQPDLRCEAGEKEHERRRQLV